MRYLHSIITSGMPKNNSTHKPAMTIPAIAAARS